MRAGSPGALVVPARRSGARLNREGVPWAPGRVPGGPGELAGGVQD